MRTTLTLDDDVARRLKEAAGRGNTSLRQIVNDALRVGLGLARRRRKGFRVVPFRGGFRPGLDPHKLNQLADELEATGRW